MSFKTKYDRAWKMEPWTRFEEVRCYKNVNFPLRKTIESISGIPDDGRFFPNDNYDDDDAGHPYGSRMDPKITSKETQKFLQILVDRLEEQFQICDLKFVGDKRYYRLPYDGGWRQATDPMENVQSEIIFSSDGWMGSGDINDTKWLRNKVNHRTNSKDIIFHVHDYDNRKEGVLRISGGFNLAMEFSVNKKTNAIKIERMTGREKKKLLDFFDPNGTGYEFVTPGQVERYYKLHPTPFTRRGHTLVSPELRSETANARSLQEILRWRFEAGNFPEGLTTQYEDLKNRMPSQDRPSKRQKTTRWDIGSIGYSFS